VIEKNQGLKNLKIIRDIHQGLNPTELLDVELTPLDIVNMKYAIITMSVNVAESLSNQIVAMFSSEIKVKISLV